MGGFEWCFEWDGRIYSWLNGIWFVCATIINWYCHCYFLYRLLMSLPVYTQRLLVLLFGTFRVIASNAERADTGMTSEALGVSVAPSFFHSCVSDGKTARMEDVLRFKVSTLTLSKINFHLKHFFFWMNLRGKLSSITWIFFHSLAHLFHWPLYKHCTKLRGNSSFFNLNYFVL